MVGDFFTLPQDTSIYKRPESTVHWPESNIEFCGELKWRDKDSWRRSGGLYVSCTILELGKEK